MDLLLLMACQENDDGKVEELLEAGANPAIKVGRSATYVCDVCERVRAEGGRLGGWEAGRLGGWAAGRLGGWAAGRLGGWAAGRGC